MSASSRLRGWWLPQAGWVALRLTVFLVIVLFVPGGTDPYAGPKVGVLLFGSSVALACHVGALATRRDRPVLPRVGVAVGAYLAAMALATAVSVSPLTSVIGRGDRHAGLVELVAMVALAWLVVVHTWRQPARLEQLVVAMAAAAGVHALSVVLVRVGIDVPWPGRKPYTIPVGTMGNSNFAGAQLVITVPLLLFLVRRAARHRGRRAPVGLVGLVGLVGVLALVLLALLLTDARGAVIALFPAVAVTGLVAPTVVPRWSVRAAVVLAVLALVTLVAAANGFSWGSGSPGSKLLNNETLTSRAQYWRGTVGLVEDHPLLGTGPDTFGLVFPRYSPREMTGRPVPVDKPHNILLERATDAGLLGLASYLAVLGLTAAAVVRARRRLTGVPLALLGAWSGALVAYLVQGLTSIDAVPLALDGWLALAALASLADPWVERARARDRAADVAARPLSPFLASTGSAVALVGLVGVLVAVVLPVLADRSLGDGVTRSAAVARGDEGEYLMTEAFELAIATDPVDPSVRITAAATVADLLRSAALSDAEKQSLASFAARESDRALEVVPDDLAARRASALAHGLLAQSEGEGAWRATDQRWRDLEALDPFDATIRVGHAHLLLDWNEAAPDDLVAARHTAARALADEANALTDDSSWFTWYLVAQAYERLGARDEAIAAARHSLTIERARPGPRDLITRLGGTP